MNCSEGGISPEDIVDDLRSLAEAELIPGKCHCAKRSDGTMLFFGEGVHCRVPLEIAGKLTDVKWTEIFPFSDPEGGQWKAYSDGWWVTLVPQEEVAGKPALMYEQQELKKLITKEKGD